MNAALQRPAQAITAREAFAVLGAIVEAQPGAYAVAVASLLALRTIAAGGPVDLTYQDLADALGVSRSAAYRAASALERIGAVRRDPGKGGAANRWTLQLYPTRVSHRP